MLVPFHHLPPKAGEPQTTADVALLRLFGFRSNRKSLELLGVMSISRGNVGLTTFTGRTLDDYDAHFAALSESGAQRFRFVVSP